MWIMVMGMKERDKSVNVTNFFFQAEDCIRVVKRSRGLGGVYKRQAPILTTAGWAPIAINCYQSVPYTHLTLPTILRV